MEYGVCSHPGCYKQVPLGARFCNRHHAQYEKAYERAAAQFRDGNPKYPWTLLYASPAWIRCREIVLKRDGYRCTHVDADGTRCPIRRTGISVHHTTLVKLLWERASGHWATFEEAASNPDICVVLCNSHHKQADDRLREEDRRSRPYTAPPRPKPSDRRRRRGR